MPKDNLLYILGYSGHAYVVLDVALSNGMLIEGYFDLEPAQRNPYNIEFCGSERDGELSKIVGGGYVFPAIGSNFIREKVTKYIEVHKLKDILLIDSSARVSKSAIIQNSTLVAPKAVVNSMAKIGKGCILNTGAIVEHECVLYDFVHVAPGAVLAGNVKVGKKAVIGANATVREGGSIGSSAGITPVGGALAPTSLNVPFTAPTAIMPEGWGALSRMSSWV